jgi:hypothetical protein
MTTYHICFEISRNLCSGVNVDALSYADALKKFGDSGNIIYI